MLLELKVKDIGIIEEIVWLPGPGLNVITGETGAGKSLVIDAVEALLSGQVNDEDIRHGFDAAHVEGVFLIPNNEDGQSLRGLLIEKGLETEDEKLIFTCDFRRQGRTTLRINRQAVSRGLLQDIGSFLVDIHGQSEHLSLLNREQHLNYLDSYAHTRELRHAFNAKFLELTQVEREVQSLVSNEQELSRQLEFLRFQVDEIQQAQLQEGEEEELKREGNLLSSAEKLKAASYEVYKLIYGDDSMLNASALEKLNEAIPALQRLMETDSTLEPKLNFLTESASGLEELARDMRSYGEHLEYNPQRVEEVETRLELIRGLKRKYGNSIAEILEYQEKTENQLNGLSNSSERRLQLEGMRDKLKAEMGTLAFQLSSARNQAAKKLQAAIKSELKDLSMSQVEFDVSVRQKQSPDGILLPDEERYEYNMDGIDIVEFITATNPGEPLKPLARIASTGELSRFMLALKGALAEADTILVLIFDEIDIGVGGRSGEVIGKKLWELSRNRQVVCVTHLPQIAAFADAHYSVHKETISRRTLSKIEPLYGESRVKELAVMLAGPNYTDTSLNAAKELLHKADIFKNNLTR